MEKTFELHIKIVDNGANTQISSSVRGETKFSTLVAMFAELIPEVLCNRRKDILLLSLLLCEGRSPSKEGLGEKYKIDLSGRKEWKNEE